MLINGKNDVMSCERMGNLWVLSFEHEVGMDINDTVDICVSVLTDKGHVYHFNSRSNFAAIVFPCVDDSTCYINASLSFPNSTASANMYMFVRS